jgi:ribosomal protein L37E
MSVTCHVCKRTGIRTCDYDEAEIKCMICGFCEAEKTRADREEAQ